MIAEATAGLKPPTASEKEAKSRPETEDPKKEGAFNFGDYLLGLQVDSKKIQSEETLMDPTQLATRAVGNREEATSFFAENQDTPLAQMTELKESFAPLDQALETSPEDLFSAADALDLRELSKELEEESTQDSEVNKALDSYVANALKTAPERSNVSAGESVIGGFTPITENFSVDRAEVTTNATTPEARPATISELFNGVQSLIQRGGGKMSVSLNPDHLGKMEIEVQTKGNEVSVEMLSESGEAKALVEGHLNGLKSSMADQDLMLSKFDVSVADHPSDFQFEQGSAQSENVPLEKPFTPVKTVRTSTTTKPIQVSRLNVSEGSVDVRV